MAASSPKSSSQIAERSASAGFRSPEGRNITARSSLSANFRMKNGGPHDSHQKSSPFKENSVSRRASSFEHKENSDTEENQLHCPKTPRSSASLNKGMKSFMAPTISAASKTSTMLKKKVLTERNTVDCSTATPRSSPEPKQSQETENLERVTTQNPSRKLEKDSKGSLKSPKIFDGVSSTDDVLPPYDPCTNYLSPRPEFLYYRPNARLESCLKDSSGGESQMKRKLDFSFTFESNSSGEENEETIASQMELPSEFNNVNDECIRDNSEADISSELETVGEIPSLVPETRRENQETNHLRTESETKVEPQEDVAETEFGAHKGYYSYSILKQTCVHVLLVIAIASFSFLKTDTPQILSSVTPYRNTSSPSLSMLEEEVAHPVLLFGADVKGGHSEIKELKMEAYSNILEEISVSLTLDSGNNPISVSGGGDDSSVESKVPQADVVLLAAETEVPRSEAGDGDQYDELKETGTEGKDAAQSELKEKDPGVDDDALGVEDLTSSSSRDYGTNFSFSVGDDYSLADYEVSQPKMMIDEPIAEAESLDSRQHFVTIIEVTESHTNIEVVLPLEQSSRITEESKTPVSMPDVYSGTGTNVLQGFWGLFSSPEESSKVFANPQEDMIICILFAVIAAIVGGVVVLFFRSYKQTRNHDAKNPDTNIELVCDSADPNSDSHSVSSNQEPIGGESYAVEMSSTSEKSAQYRRRRDLRTENSEVVSHNLDLKVPVSAASSGWDSEGAGSPSYGSFTTYERLPTKQGQVEEGVVTPVRRSSRLIKKQIISS